MSATPAGFWRRYAAYSLDAVAVSLLALPIVHARWQETMRAVEQSIAALQMRIWELFDATALDADLELASFAARWLEDAALRSGLQDLAALLLHAAFVSAAIVAGVGALWFVTFESSTWQATPGKRALGLQVTRVDGTRPEPWRALLRFVAGIPSWLLLHLGHALAGWTREKRAAHDFIAGTRVLLAPGAEPRMPGWAQAWLWLQAAALCAGAAWVALRYVAMLEDVAADF